MLHLTALTPQTVTLDGTLADFRLFALYNHLQAAPFGLPMGCEQLWQNNLEYSRAAQFSGIVFQAPRPPRLDDCVEQPGENWCGIFRTSQVWVWTLECLVGPDLPAERLAA